MVIVGLAAAFHHERLIDPIAVGVPRLQRGGAVELEEDVLAVVDFAQDRGASGAA